MIGRILPRRDARSRDQCSEFAEAFALIYYAKYNDTGDLTRARTSFFRAWGMETLTAWQRVPNGRPAFVVATWNDGQNVRATVAIEGATSQEDILRVGIGTPGTQLGPAGSHVLSLYHTYATSIKATLLGFEPFASIYARPGAPLCFSGFSLGAAIAEVLTVMFKGLRPNQPITCRKFASPRVGNSAYITSSNLGQIVKNWYCLMDPVSAIPPFTSQLASSLTAEWDIPVINFCNNINKWRGDLNGEGFPTNEYNGAHGFAVAFAALRRPMTGDNPWLHHSYDMYRMMMSGVVSLASSYNSLLPYRFNFLEFPDDNSWGQRLSARDRDPVYCRFMAVPPPPDVAVPGMQEEPALIQAIAAPQLVAPPPMVQDLPVRVVVPRPQGTWVPRRVRDL